MIRGNLSTVTPHDTNEVVGSVLLVLAAGNLALKGTQTGAAATAAFAVTAGQQLYIPGAIVVMSTNTTATVAVMG